MKILFTVSTYFPLRDGVQAVTTYLAEGLAQLGHSVTVFTSSKGDTLAPEEYHCGVRIVRFDISTRAGLYFGKKRNYIASVIQETNNTDFLINVCTQCANTDLLLPHLHQIKCPKMLYIHGIWDFRWNSMYNGFAYKLWANMRWWYYYVSQRKNLREYDLISQLSEDDGYKLFNKLGIENQVIMTNAVEEFFFFKPRSWIEERKEKVLITVGSYSDRKNQKFVVDAFILSKSTDTRLVLIGNEENEYYRSLKSYIDSLDDDKSNRISLLTNITRIEIADYLKSAYLFLFGSREEKQPVCILEAMATGLPFVSTDVGCVSSFPGGNIISTPDEMADRINFLVENPSEWEVLSQKGYEYAEKNARISDKVKDLNNLILNTIHKKNL